MNIRTFALTGLLLQGLLLAAQPADDLVAPFLSRLTLEEKVPTDLLARKSLLLFDETVTPADLRQVQRGFQKTGIDAVIHYPLQLALSAEEITKQFTEYMVKREIRFLIFFHKKGSLFEFVFVPFNGKGGWVTDGHSAWQVVGSSLNDMLQSIYRTTAATQKKKNFLISEEPETFVPLRPVSTERSEFFAVSLKNDAVAVIRTGNASFDQRLEALLKEKYPFKVQYFPPGTGTDQLRSKGCFYTLRQIHASASEAMRLLGYSVSASAKTVTTYSFSNGKQGPREIGTETVVWKFYVRHIDSGNIFLGLKWDADEDMTRAMENYVQGFQTSLGMEVIKR